MLHPSRNPSSLLAGVCLTLAVTGCVMGGPSHTAGLRTSGGGASLLGGAAPGGSVTAPGTSPGSSVTAGGAPAPATPVAFDPARWQRGHDLFNNNCAGCHGSFETTVKLGATADLIREGLATQPVMAATLNASGVTAANIEDIGYALSTGLRTAPAATSTPTTTPAPGATPAPTTTSSPLPIPTPTLAGATGGANPFSCAAGASPNQTLAATDLRRLTRSEYRATLAQLFGAAIPVNLYQSQLDLVPADVVGVAQIFDTGDATVAAGHVQGYLAVARQLASLAVASNTWMTSTLNCGYTAGMTDACWANFFGGFGTRTFRRALTADEMTAYKALYAAGAQSATDVAGGLQAVLETMLQSPNFLYKTEYGGTVSGDAATLALTDYELATRLAYLATGQAPDAALIADAAAGLLHTDAGWKVAVSRAFASTAAQTHLRDFYSQWLGLNQIPDQAQPAWFLQGVNASSLKSESVQELDDFMDYYIWNAGGNYTDVLTSQKDFLSNQVALPGVYGVASATASGTVQQTINGPDFTHTNGRAEEGGWNLNDAGSLTRNLTLVAGQSYKVVINARTSLYSDGTGAHMVVSWNGTPLGAITLSSTQYQDYAFSLVANPASAALTITFDNDAYDAASGADRNLYVMRAQLVPVTAAMAATSGLPPDQRVGVLGRAARLLGQNTRPSTVHRGLIVRRNLLCATILPPSAVGIDPALTVLPAPDPKLTTRQQLEQKTSPALCQSCHTQLNPFGFILESYDAIGRYRTQETVWDQNGAVLATLPIDTNVTPNIDAAGDAPVSSLKELAGRIATSSTGPSCLARQWFTYSNGRAPDLGVEGCRMTRMWDALTNAQAASASGDQAATLLNLFKSMAFDPAFKLHKQGPTQ